MITLALLFAMLAGPASATSVGFAWVGSSSPASGLGTSTVSLSGPATLTLDLVLGADAEGIAVLFSSLEFDDELDIISFEELSWSGSNMMRLDPFTSGIQSSLESDAITTGQLYTFDATTLGDGPVSATLAFGRVVFAVRPASDGPDVFAGLFNTGIDGVFNNAGNEVIPIFGTAAVNLNAIPEPATLVLLGLGLAALAVSRRA